MAEELAGIAEFIRRETETAAALRDLAAAEREAGFAAGEKLGLERAAGACKAIGKDWRDDGQDLKSYAAEYLVDYIRSLPLTPKES